MFINFEQNNWAEFPLMAKFAYNKAKNTSTSQIFFESNCKYHFQILFKKKVDSCSKSKLANKLLSKLREEAIICRANFFFAQKLQKKTQNIGVKPKNCAFSNKIMFNSKYIKTKQN